MHLVVSGGGLDLLNGGVVDETLLGFALLSGEEDELGLVGVESLDVELELLVAGRGPSVVDRDSNSGGEASAKASTLKLSESEATSVPDLAGIAARR